MELLWLWQALLILAKSRAELRGWHNIDTGSYRRDKGKVPNGRAGVSADVCQPLASPGPLSPSASMVDPTIKLLLASSPKAGATLVERLMLARLNLTGAAIRYKNGKGYPLAYSHAVFQEQNSRRPKAHHLHNCEQGGDTADWVCITIVRNPLNRAISSYIFTLSHYDVIAKEFHELAAVSAKAHNASFSEFSQALTRRAQVTKSRSNLDDHFMPQSIHGKRGEGGLNPGVIYVPIEMLEKPGSYECPGLERVRGTDMKALEGKFGANNSEHYVKQVTSHLGSEHWSFDEILSAKKKDQTPSYDSFWGDKALCKHVVGCLYQNDLKTYVGACRIPGPLQRCAPFRATCEEQLKRLRDVCGLDV